MKKKAPICLRGHDTSIVGRTFERGCKACFKERNIEKYGIDLPEYNRLFQIQGGMCGICNRHQSAFKISLAIDHCHKTKKVRGLLCQRCNMEVGLFERLDLKAIKEYLKKSKR